MEWLIWSIEHQAWWAANRAGYTRKVQDAGVYSRDAALEIVRTSNLISFEECAIPLECVERWAAENDCHAQGKGHMFRGSDVCEFCGALKE